MNVPAAPMPAQPRAGARRRRRGLRRDGTEGPDRGGRPARRRRRRHGVPPLPDEAGAASRPCSTRCTSRCSTTRSTARRAIPTPARRSNAFFVALPEFQPGTARSPSRWRRELDLPRRRSRCATSCARDRRARRRARRPPARSAPTSARPTSSLLFSGVAHATALAGELQPVLRERYVRIILDGLRPHDASPLPGGRSTSRSCDKLKRASHEVNDSRRARRRRCRQRRSGAAGSRSRSSIMAGVHRRARQHGAQRRDPDDPARVRHDAAEPRVGHHRLRAHVRDVAHHRRPARRHLRAPPHLHHRRRAVRRRLAASRRSRRRCRS